MEDETYRFGIVFKDSKGRKSFVRWIADIRMPHLAEGTTDGYIAKPAAPTGDIVTRSLYLKFTVKSLPDDQDGTAVESWEIVRVKKNSLTDKNILMQGFLKSYLFIRKRQMGQYFYMMFLKISSYQIIKGGKLILRNPIKSI